MTLDISDINAEFVFCLPLKCTFILFISYVLPYKKPLQNSKQLPLYLLNIQWVHTLAWAQLGVSPAGPTWDPSSAVAQPGPPSLVQLGLMVLTLSWTSFFTWSLIFKELRTWASSPTAMFQDDDRESYTAF